MSVMMFTQGSSKKKKKIFPLVQKYVVAITAFELPLL